jgi:hypothetical protein
MLSFLCIYIQNGMCSAIQIVFVNLYQSPPVPSKKKTKPLALQPCEHKLLLIRSLM